MSNGITLPDVQQAHLDVATLDALFSDIATFAHVYSVVVKHGAGRVEEQGTTLEEGRAALASGTARGVQIRYRHDGVEWCDTLLNTPAGVRLVRVSSDQVVASANAT